MKTAFPLLFLLLFGAVSNLAAQTSATFTFGKLQGYGVINMEGDECSPMTGWNGVPNANPEDIGDLCFTYYPYGMSGIEVPQQLGFPNNGYLLDSGPQFTLGPQVFTSGNATTNGSTYTQAGSVVLTGSGAGVTINWTGNFHVSAHNQCYRGRCILIVYDYLDGGSGVATYQP